MTSFRGSFKANFSEMNEFPKQLFKKISNEIHNVSLLFHTVLESEESSLSPTVQLDCSLTLEMSD